MVVDECFQGEFCIVCVRGGWSMVVKLVVSICIGKLVILSGICFSFGGMLVFIDVESVCLTDIEEWSSELLFCEL